jgi:hypothetical protein
MINNTPPETPGKDVPLRLDVAVQVAFPCGGMTVSGLRRERDAGRLETMRIAGKDFTTLAAIDRMLDQCRAPPKAPASISTQAPMPMSSETEKLSRARDAALETARKLKESLAK